jgi:hypothetical protein
MSDQVSLWTGEYVFGDERFMSMREKHRVLSVWRRFIRSGFQWEQFSSALYRHLSLHCSLAAHHDRYGFWHFFFSSDPQDFCSLLRQFGGDHQSAELGGRWWLDGPTGADLNRAMCREMEVVCAALLGELDLSAPQVTQAQRDRLGVVARATLRARQAQIARLAPGLGGGVQASLWDVLDPGARPILQPVGVAS